MNSDPKIDPMDPSGPADEWLSALMDGEARESEFDALFDAGSAGADLHSRWHCYQLLGDSLRQSEPLVTVRGPQDFLAGVMARLSEEGVAPLQLAPSVSTIQVRAPAANDAVMRWKWLAAVASVTAVVAVSWGALNASSPGTGAASGTQLANNGAEIPAPLSLVSQPVAVNTDQGTLIRDDRLEQLLAEHRQYGGASALQMPAGFLRNATYETAPQR
ncbi:MAG: sigma-E factor negative regulatory protein [Hydrogenophaga sp.]